MSTKSIAEANKVVANAHTKPILLIIEMQQMPVKEVLTGFANVMLDNTNQVNHHTT